MNRRISRLLKKQSWTGKEVGQLLMASLVRDIQRSSNPRLQPLFTPEEFAEMENSLKDDYEWRYYNVYADLHRTTLEAYNRLYGVNQQFSNGMYKINMEIRELQHDEDTKNSLRNIPLIVTEEQYNRYRDFAIEATGSLKESFNALLMHTIDKCCEQGVDVPAGIRTELDKLKEKPVKGDRYTEQYNLLYGNGYYVLPDGTRSDSYSEDGWKELIAKRYADRLGLEFKTTEELLQFVKDEREEQIHEAQKLFFKGGEYVKDLLGKKGKHTAEEYEEALYRIVRLTSLRDCIDAKGTAMEEIEEYLGMAINECKWVYYDSLPAGTTEYDLLGVYYDRYISGEENALADMKKDFPALYNSVKEYLEGLLPELKALKANQRGKEVVTWKRLCEAGVIGYEDILTPNDWTIAEYSPVDGINSWRGSFNSFAIVKNPREDQVDSNGDFIEKVNPFYGSVNSIEELGVDEDTIDVLHSHYDRLIIPAMRYLYAYNEMIKIYADVYDVPDYVEAMSFDMGNIEDMVEAYNRLLYIFHANINEDGKRAVIREAFRDIDIESLKPTKEAIEKTLLKHKKARFTSSANYLLSRHDETNMELRNIGREC